MIAELLAGQQPFESRLSWSDSEGTRVTMTPRTAARAEAGELLLVGEPLNPMVPEGLDPSLQRDQTCTAEVLVEPAGEVGGVTVTGCPTAFASEVVRALREWRFDTAGANDPIVTTQRFAFRYDNSTGRLAVE